MSHQRDSWIRVRYTATGALAALAAAGAVAGSVALAAGSQANGSKDETTTMGVVTKTPAAPLPTNTQGSEPNSGQLFLNAVALLVSNGTITAAEGRTLDAEIQTGGVDSEALAASGFTQQQLQVVQQTLGGVKESIANAVHNSRTGAGTRAKTATP